MCIRDRNMMDIVKKRGDVIDVKKLSQELGVPVVELSLIHIYSGIEHQKYLLTLKDSKLANEELLDRLYEQVIEEYSLSLIHI